MVTLITEIVNVAIKNAIPNMMNIETVKDDAAFVPSSSSTRSSEKGNQTIKQWSQYIHASMPIYSTDKKGPRVKEYHHVLFYFIYFFLHYVNVTLDSKV